MITVHWSTHDLDEYYAQIKQIPHLSQEEQQQLVTLLAHSEQGHYRSSPDTLQAARHRLIEGHLRRAAAIAVRECPPSRYRLLPELVEAANLALVEAMRRCDVQHPADLSSYLLTTVRGVVRRVLANENLMRVPDTTRQHARANGTAERFAVFATASLDVLMHPFDDDGEREPCAAPLLPTAAAPERDPALRAQVEGWLALLSPRAQAVLRLRYGLSDEDERAHITARPRWLACWDCRIKRSSRPNAARASSCEFWLRVRRVETAQMNSLACGAGGHTRSALLPQRH